jgi:hypothetical protein
MNYKVMFVRSTIAILFITVIFHFSYGTKDYSASYYEPGVCVEYFSSNTGLETKGIIKWTYSSPFYEIAPYIVDVGKYASSNETVSQENIIKEVTCE